MAEPTLRFDDSVSWREIDGEIIALDLRAGTYFSINASGVVLFRSLVEGATRSSLVGALQSECGVSEDIAHRDVDAFISQCRDKGLITDA
jgi:hypothetical protein